MAGAWFGKEVTFGEVKSNGDSDITWHIVSSDCGSHSIGAIVGAIVGDCGSHSRQQQQCTGHCQTKWHLLHVVVTALE